MNERWNLDSLYHGFSDPNFTGDLQALKVACGRFDTFTKSLEEMDPAHALRQGVESLEEIARLVNQLAEYASLRQAADTGDAEANSAMGQVMAVYSQCAGADARFQAYAAELPNLDALLEADELLRQYQFYFRQVREGSRYLLGSQGEDIMARMQLSGSSAWSDLQAYLTSTVEVDYDGGITNLSAIRNLAYDGNPAVRKAAYEAELACYDKIKDSVAFALNSIKLETINAAPVSYTHLTLPTKA